MRNAEAGSGSESVKSDVHRVPEDRLQQRAGWSGARSTVQYVYVPRPDRRSIGMI